MRLIADSGSTKVDWRILGDNGSLFEITTAGINPFFQSEEQICKELETSLKTVITEKIDEVHFYGAGVSGDKGELLKNCFKKIFPKSSAFAYTDLLAAARALCGRKPGIAAILGTGSNSCFYDGEKIADNVPACGFILGDEGSGAVLGKKFISDFLKREIPEDLNFMFAEKYQLDYNSVIERVYRQPFPNRFLSTFSLFLYGNITHPYVNSLLRNSFGEFITRNILKYDFRQFPLNMVGSVAFYYREIITDVAAGYGVKIGTVLKSPIDGLVKFHRS